MGERDTLRLIQFTREPVPGRVKTRMLPALTPHQACELHCDLTRWTLAALRSVGRGPVELCVAGDPQHPFFRECADTGGVEITRQGGGDLGARMYAALAAGLERSSLVILVGSDCPEIDGAYIEAAAAALADREVVLGPAQDGGYVLIGVRALRREWFEGIAWGTGEVYAATVAALAASGADFAALAPLADIDRPEDLELWRSIRAGAGAGLREPGGSGADGV